MNLEAGHTGIFKTHLIFLNLRKKTAATTTTTTTTTSTNHSAGVIFEPDFFPPGSCSKLRRP